MFRVGLGQDIHRLVPGRRFLLGGTEIPAEKGELGHSDGDALCHAAADALLGAAGVGDVGELFPPTDAAFKDADSRVLLQTAFGKVKKAGWRLVSLDCVVICEKPKILPYRERIRSSLAAILEVEPSSVMVKGKTCEGLGHIGQGLAVEVVTICLLESVWGETRRKKRLTVHGRNR
ncbi:MAG: 2-C-methyl-D-erythritol 2,4-cyclodiphosphate synthase [Treponema sp.]|nr:2-C-methyl-D-erythritol 2,4-cyclodiphosphate synthase [Treponema sp.]